MFMSTDVLTVACDATVLPSALISGSNDASVYEICDHIRVCQQMRSLRYHRGVLTPLSTACRDVLNACMYAMLLPLCGLLARTGGPLDVCWALLT